MVSPKIIILFLLTVTMVVVLKLSNPHRAYSTQEYWESATVSDVSEIPQAVILSGNKNGSVLMWAATAVNDPSILKALVDRGAEINEVDGVFLGTPLSGAASYNSNPQIIDTLMALGADIDARFSNNNGIIAVSAMYNHSPGIIDSLVAHGADLTVINDDGMDALDMANYLENEVAVAQLLKYFSEGE